MTGCIWGFVLVVTAAVFAFPADVTVVYKGGKSIHVKDAGFHEGPNLAEEDGVPVGFRSMPSNSALSKYTESHTKLGLVGGVYFYVPWSRIEEVEIINAKGPDEYSHPAKLKMRDGKLLDANIILNGADPFLIGNTENGGPAEEYHSTLVKDRNCSIRITKIARIKPIYDSQMDRKK